MTKYDSVGKKFALSKWIALGAAFIIIVFTLILIIGGVMAAGPFKYVEVSFKGIDGKGSAVIEIDRAAMAEKALGKIGKSESQNEYSAKLSSIKAGIDYTVEGNAEGLSNGDKITVSLVCTGEAGQYFKNEEKTYKVSGLKKVKTIDAFKDLEISFKGVSGDAKISLKNKSENPFLKEVEYSCDKWQQLSNGDTVTVTVSYSDTQAARHGYIPKENTKKVEIKDLDTFLTKVEQIPEADFQKIIDALVEQENQREDDFMFSYGEAKFHSAYLKVKTDDARPSADLKCSEIVIYIAQDEYLRGEYRKTNYFVRSFYDVVVPKSGDKKVELKLEDIHRGDSVTDIETVIDRMNKDTSFVVTKVK